MNPISQALAERYSCRDFSNTPLESELLDDILNDAMRSPSWSNTQPYRIALAQGKTKEHLSAELQRRYAKAVKIQRGSTFTKLTAFISGNDGLPKGDFKQALSYPDELQKRRLVTAKGLYSLLDIQRNDADKRDAQTGRNFDFFGAPSVLFVSANCAPPDCPPVSVFADAKHSSSSTTHDADSNNFMASTRKYTCARRSTSSLYCPLRTQEATY